MTAVTAEGRTMTAGELRTLLSTVDADAPVEILGGRGYLYAIDGGTATATRVELNVEGDDEP